MKQGNRAIIAVLLVVFIVVGYFHGVNRAQASDASDKAKYDANIKATQEMKEKLAKQLEEAKAQKAELEKKRAESQKYLEELSNDIEKVTKYIQEVDEQLQGIYDTINDLNYQISEKEEELEETKKELADAIQCQEEQYESMKKRIRYVYENGTESIWEILVNSKSLEDLLNRVEYRVRISEYDKNLLERYCAAVELVKATKAYLEASIENLNELKAAAEDQQKDCEALVATKSEQLEAYAALYQIEDELIFKYGEQLDDASMSIEEIYAAEEKRAKEEAALRKAEEERLAEIERKRIEEEKRKAEEQKKKEEEARKKAEAERQAALLAQRLNAASGVTMTWETGISNIIWPLPGDGRTYSGFGPRKAPLPGASTFHNGVDIGGVQGATIVASLAGTVIQAAYNWSGGNTIVIDHGNGVKTKYCHASKLLVSVGDTVMQGQPIALVGSTGVSTGPHLHFAIMINNVYVDPMKYIKYTGN